MPTYDVTFQIQLTDVNGNSAITDLVLYGEADTNTTANWATAVASYAALIAACTNAKVTRTSVSILFTKAQISAGTAPPPASAVYPSVTDGARLIFGSSTGVRRSVTIPAPLLTDFKTGQNVVNPADGNIAPLIASITALGVPAYQTNLYEGGAKVGRSARRRVAHRSL
jgi:hypothetical protein